MNTLPLLKAELEAEYNTTQKFFAIFPEGKNDYAPHEKSMKMMALASHIAAIFAWPEIILNTEVLDFAKSDFMPPEAENGTQLKTFLDENFKTGIEALDKITEENLTGTWGLANDGHEIASWSKYGAIRHGLDQVTHHRAQLGVYYRLLNIDVPGSYGPSADDQSF